MMYKTGLIVGTALLGCASTTIHAVDSSSRYQAWQPPAGEVVQSTSTSEDGRLQTMIDELNKLVDDADKARAADRRFIEDLRDIINQYDWPWRTTVLTEDFTDGVLQQKSLWKISSGDYELKRGLGLYSSVTPQQAASEPEPRMTDKEAAAMLFGAILNQAMKTSKQSSADSPASNNASANARITATRAISNAFAIDMNVDVRNHEADIVLGVYQGQPSGVGYRLVFQPGASASIEIQRVGTRGNSIIGVIDTITARGDRIHRLQWTRSTTGNMQVILNDKTVLEVADRSYKDKFSGLLIDNQGGEIAIQKLTIQGT